MSIARLEAVVERLALPAGGRVIEVGCGKAEWLVRILERWPVRAVGLDRSPWFLADALARATAAGVGDRLDLREANAAVGLDAAVGEGPPDLLISIGAGGIFGGQAESLERLAAVVARGGAVLYGEGIWTSEPSPAGLTAFGMARDELPDGIAGQQALARAAGLEPAWTEVVSVQEWDDYEAAYARPVEPWLAANPDDPDGPAFAARAAAMRDSYAAWRRAAMGFAISLLRRPAA